MLGLDDHLWNGPTMSCQWRHRPRHAIDGTPHGLRIRWRQQRFSALPEAKEVHTKMHHTGEVGPEIAGLINLTGWLACLLGWLGWLGSGTGHWDDTVGYSPGELGLSQS